MERERRGMLCLFLLQLVFVLGDLPVHCLHKSVTGSWKLDISSGSSKFHNCGFKAPDRNRDHQNAYKFDVEHSKHVSLNEPNLVSGDLTGYWTMVYDEGFEIRANETKYFAFSKYEPKGETLWQQSNELTDYVSDCGETLVGWWESDLGQYGCWKGVKSDAESLKGATNDLVTTSVLSPVDRLKEKVLAKESGKDGAKGAVSSAFVMNFEKKFEPDYSYIERVNKDTSSTWQASVHAPFVGRTWKEMKALLGIGNYVTANFTKVTAKARTKGKYNLMSLQADQTPSGLPLSWDWRNVSGVNYDSPVVNQGGCGACYAIAGTQMIESRVRVATKNQLQPILSAQNILDCSVYNQGCDGGYPYLVMKHAHDFGMIEATCSPYSATSSNCDSSLLKPRPVGIELQRAAARATKACDRRYYVSDFHYIGGYYGGTTETEMMKELYKNGPIVVAFQAPPTLFYYSNGIFTGARPKDEKNSGVVHAWEQANHAVVVVGYGVENGKKFWTIKNTWGAQWGEGGYFRIMRGTDECGIESMSSYATVLV